jgi:hypothetical protein
VQQDLDVLLADCPAVRAIHRSGSFGAGFTAFRVGGPTVALVIAAAVAAYFSFGRLAA